jgi:hypothetical protein
MSNAGEAGFAVIKLLFVWGFLFISFLILVPGGCVAGMVYNPLITLLCWGIWFFGIGLWSIVPSVIAFMSKD